MIREIITASSESTKLGVTDSQIASVRTQVEQETAVRVYAGGHAGVASAVGSADVDMLTERARAGLGFQIAYPAQPSADRKSEVSHMGRARSVGELVELTTGVIETLRENFPQYVFGHGLEQSRVGWRIHNDLGLDLSYERMTTQVAFLVKEKGSGSIFDTFVGTEGLDLDAASLIERFSAHLRAFGTPLGPPPSGKQRVVFPGLEGHAGGGLMQLIRSDMLARVVGTKASVFQSQLGTGEQVFSSSLSIQDSRDANRWRIAPFDMEGVVRSAPDHSLVHEGVLGTAVASKRDAVRYGVPATGSGVGELAQLPVTGIGKLVVQPTAERLVDLLDGQPALMPWFVAGGDCTRAGDLGMPCQVLLRVEADGTVSGRYTGCTLSGSIYDALGSDFVGVSEQRLDADSEESFLVTHMSVSS